MSYNVDTGVGRIVFRRGKSWHNVQPSLTEKGVWLRVQKVQEISKLITTHFGQAWEEREEQRTARDLEEMEEYSDCGEDPDDEADLIVWKKCTCVT
ncbi:hypothetical protein PR048_000102 [Dryococelus australis]|uniref:Uncharacterized protein n=1 Tax=Dryococelus australis TaxID=614101 RepID=A0ABQ9IDQ3_9NEOP|nr:hypothetical protein PR048_000102 [Dryococelus australis]